MVCRVHESITMITSPISTTCPGSAANLRDAAGFLRQIVRRNISNHDLVARGLEFFSPIERAEQFLAHVEFLGELFARARVSQGRKLLHALQLGRNFFNKWTAHVVR